jgi:glutamyl-Q tRNA(Asp) synthetase
MGSLLAAIASYCQAKNQQGEWLIRIEDVDETRTVAGAEHSILTTLSHYGMVSDRPVIRQTADDRQAAYQQALEQLKTQDLIYPCNCTRKQLKGLEQYPGTCREHPPGASQPCALRLRTNDQTQGFHDLIQGPQKQSPQDQCGDFVVRRKDGLFAYQLAVVVDDADQGITEVVRGIDIMDSTGRQMYLQQRLGLPTPAYAHIPVLMDDNGRKLSKQNHARPVTLEEPYQTTLYALRLLQQPLPRLTQKSQSALMKFASEHWRADRLSGLKAL